MSINNNNNVVLSCVLNQSYCTNIHFFFFNYYSYYCSSPPVNKIMHVSPPPPPPPPHPPAYYSFLPTLLVQDREVQCLLLTHKSSRDMSHNINKTEMRRLSTLLAQQPSRGTDPVELSQPDTVEEQQIVPLKDNAGFPVDNDKGPPTERFKVSGKEKGASGQTQGDGSKLRPSDFFAKTSFRSRGSSHDPDYKRRFPTVAVAMVWDNIGMLNTLETSCLEEACRLHNPMMSLDLHRAVYLCAITKVNFFKNQF